MADVLHFDVNKAMDQFLRIFWKKGFKATTTKELAKEAGISEGSLFHTFSSKRAIFIKVLTRYREKSRFMLDRMDASPSALDGIRDYWLTMAEYVADTSRTQGCMITNATIELANDPEILAFLKTIHIDYDKEFKRVLNRAVKQGELRADTDITALAQYLAHSAQGLRVLTRINPGKKKAQNIVDMTMSTLNQFKC